MENELDRTWIDDRLARLAGPLDRHLRGAWSLYAPSAAFYGLLESGDDDDLQQAVEQMAGHVGLDVAPLAAYELGLRMRFDVAGQISQGGHRRSRIQIPLFYVGKPLPLGAILAHELTHEVLRRCQIAGADPLETERLTDLASIALGLGCVVLNGAVLAEAAQAEAHVLGYLSPRAKAYALGRTAMRHGIARGAVAALLAPAAAETMAQVGSIEGWP
jgi:hypothetical protein